jgi:hypothetical protein
MTNDKKKQGSPFKKLGPCKIRVYPEKKIMEYIEKKIKGSKNVEKKSSVPQKKTKQKLCKHKKSKGARKHNSEKKKNQEKNMGKKTVTTPSFFFFIGRTRATDKSRGLPDKVSNICDSRQACLSFQHGDQLHSWSQYFFIDYYHLSLFLYRSIIPLYYSTIPYPHSHCIYLYLSLP